MEDSDINHGKEYMVSGYQNSAYPSAPNTLKAPVYVQAVYGYNFESKSSALHKIGTTRWNNLYPPTYLSNPNQYQIRGNLSTWTNDANNGFYYQRNNITIDSYSTSINQGQGILGDMDNYVHIFEIFRYKITSISNYAVSTPSGTSTHIIDVDAMDLYSDFADATDKATRTQNSLDLFAEYGSQPTNSIWKNASSSWGVTIFNLTKQDFWLFWGMQGSSILASNINTNTAFNVNDEIIVMYGE